MVKIQYKAGLIITLFGAFLIVLISYWFGRENYTIAINSKQASLKSISKEISFHLNSHLEEKISIAQTITTAPCVENALSQSNHMFSKFSSEERKREITELNQRWRDTKDINDSFIQSYMQNSVATYLKDQQTILPNEYGEIFLTNRYGALVSTTGKLTTLAHSQKYWWKESYNDGKGKVFLDDRGFDASVDGYVLGIVVPIKKDDEIVGILKCNVNIASSLTNPIIKYKESNDGDLKIVRTGGLVVREIDKTPLSTEVPKSIQDELQKKTASTIIISEKDTEKLVSTSTVPITLGSNSVGFGGKKKSIDHSKGNVGESWHVVICVPKKIIITNAYKTTQKIIVASIISILVTAIIAMLLGKIIAKPIINLSHVASKIGQGNLQTRTGVCSTDEVGILAKSIDTMAENIELSYDEKEKVINDLKVALDEINVLKGIIPICSYCKKIRNDKGAWDALEAYMSKHTDAKFSHAVCPECEKRIMEELENE